MEQWDQKRKRRRRTITTFTLRGLLRGESKPTVVEDYRLGSGRRNVLFSSPTKLKELRKKKGRQREQYFFTREDLGASATGSRYLLFGRRGGSVGKLEGECFLFYSGDEKGSDFVLSRSRGRWGGGEKRKRTRTTLSFWR